MIRLPDDFERISLTALPSQERRELLCVLETKPHARGLRLRHGATVQAILDRVSLLGEVPWAAGSYYIDTDSRAGTSPLHDAGAYYLQEPSAMAAAFALDVQPGMHVLDLCAAPGGKSGQIAARLAGTGLFVSNEIVPARAKVLSQNMERMGVANGIVTNMSPDALASRWGAHFDAVLVDAPCSGEGMFRREPQGIAEWTPESPAGCAARQLNILDSAAQLLHEGGCIVYSTCTFNETENERVVEGFLAKHTDFALEPFSLGGGLDAKDGCLRLWPHRVRGEGHFVARLKRRGTLPVREVDTARIDISDCIPDVVEATLAGQLLEAGAFRWVMPPNAPPLRGIRALRTGLCVAEKRGSTWFPHHALSHAVPSNAFLRRYDADDAQAACFLRGEAIPAEEMGKGFAVVTYAGFGLGLAKHVDGMMKNHLPKGLRRP